jgi:hypothetical protein
LLTLLLTLALALVLLAVSAVGTFFLFIPDVVAAGDDVADADGSLDGNGEGIATEVDGGFEVVGNVDLSEGGFCSEGSVDAERATVNLSGIGVDLVGPANVYARTVENIEPAAEDILMLFAEQGQ